MQSQPMIDAILERRHLRIETGETTVMFDNGGALVEKSLPVLDRPTIGLRPQQPNDPGLVARSEVENSRCRLLGCCPHEIVTLDFEFNSGLARRLQGLGRAHNTRPVNRLAPGFSGAD